MRSLGRLDVVIEATDFSPDLEAVNIRNVQRLELSTEQLWPHLARKCSDDPPLAGSQRDVEVKPYQHRSQNGGLSGAIVAGNKLQFKWGIDAQRIQSSGSD